MEKKRLMSLDALRGFDMLFIIGLPAVICAVSNLLGWGTNWWLPMQMKHALAVWMATRLYGVGHHHGFNPLRGAADWLFGGLAAVCGPQWGALVSALGYVAVCWGALYFLYRKNIFFRA